MKKIVSLVFMIFIFSQIVLAQEDYSLRGYLQLDNYYYSDSDVQENFVSETGLGCQLTYFLSDNWRFKADFMFRANSLDLEESVFDERQEYRPFVSTDEIYLGYFQPEYDLYMGINKVNWGVTDRFNPIDLFNPYDLTDLINDREIGVPMLVFSYYPDHQEWNIDFDKIEIVLVPWFVPSRLPPPNSYFFLEPELPIEQNLPSYRVENIQAGILLTRRFDNLQLRGMYYYGYEHLPFISLDLADPFEPQFVYDYYRKKAVGGAVEYAVKQWVFRAEGAFYYYEDVEDEEYGQYVFGVDYNFGQVYESYGLYTNVQYIFETPEREDPYWIRHLFHQALTTQFIFGNEFSEAGFEAVWFLPDDGYILIPSLSHTWQNNFSVKFEYNYIYGEPDSFWSMQEQNQRYLLTVKYAF